MPTILPSRMPISALTTPVDRIDDRRVLDDDVENSVRRFEVAVDALAIAQILACADQELVSVDRIVVLDLGEELRIAEPDKVALGRAVKVGIGSAGSVSP